MLGQPPIYFERHLLENVAEGKVERDYYVCWFSDYDHDADRNYIHDFASMVYAMVEEPDYVHPDAVIFTLMVEIHLDYDGDDGIDANNIKRLAGLLIERGYALPKMAVAA